MPFLLAVYPLQQVGPAAGRLPLSACLLWRALLLPEQQSALQTQTQTLLQRKLLRVPPLMRMEQNLLTSPEPWPAPHPPSWALLEVPAGNEQTALSLTDMLGSRIYSQEGVDTSLAPNALREAYSGQ